MAACAMAKVVVGTDGSKPGEVMLRSGLKCHGWLAMPVCVVRPGVLTPEAFPGTRKRLTMRIHLYKSVYVQRELG